MGINELCELIAKALADGKQIVYDYSKDEATGYDREYQWSHVVSAKMDRQDLVLGLNNGYDMWPISISNNDQASIDEFIARVVIYDTLLAPRDVVLGTGKVLLAEIIK